MPSGGRASKSKVSTLLRASVGKSGEIHGDALQLNSFAISRFVGKAHAGRSNKRQSGGVALRETRGSLYPRRRVIGRCEPLEFGERLQRLQTELLGQRALLSCWGCGRILPQPSVLSGDPANEQDKSP